MANLYQSKKRIRQNEKRRIINKNRMSSVRTCIKKFLKLILERNKSAALFEYSNLISKIDRGVSKGLFHKNKADRYKRRFNFKLKSI